MPIRDSASYAVPTSLKKRTVSTRRLWIPKHIHRAIQQGPRWYRIQNYIDYHAPRPLQPALILSRQSSLRLILYQRHKSSDHEDLYPYVGILLPIVDAKEEFEYFVPEGEDARREGFNTWREEFGLGKAVKSIKGGGGRGDVVEGRGRGKAEGPATREVYRLGTFGKDVD